MSVLPLGDNTRLEVVIYPWGITTSSGESLSEAVSGVWFTKLSPYYSHELALDAHFGRLISDIPDILIKMSIWESSRWADNITITSCPSPDTDYYANIRRRYVTLLSGLNLILNHNGLNPVTRKMLGDFEIEFDTNLVNSMLPKIEEEIKKLEPIVQGGGCLGLGTSQLPTNAIKGANDPYRPFHMNRSMILPTAGDDPAFYGVVSPAFNRSNPRKVDKFSKGGQRYFRNRGR